MLFYHENSIEGRTSARSAVKIRKHRLSFCLMNREKKNIQLTLEIETGHYLQLFFIYPHIKAIHCVVFPQLPDAIRMASDLLGKLVVISMINYIPV